ncbi:periplasmic heavy metal sensor [Myxococcota bacterium]|nr:periplasmic heavy metal sensor [Myxococcota bacterium]
MRNFLAAASLIAVLWSPLPAHAFGDEGPPMDFPKVAEQLGLSAEQRQKVMDEVYRADGAMVDIRARAEKAGLELKHQLGQETLDEKAVLAAVEALAAAESDMKRNRVRLTLALRKVLTFEQWRELARIREERHGGPGGGGPPSPGGGPMRPRR